MEKVILDLCGGSGAWSRPYRENGYVVQVITLPNNDVRTFIPPKIVYGILCAPPCVEFSIAKDHKLERDFVSAMDIVNACFRIIHQCNPVFWAIENPTGLLRNYLHKPKYTFQPWEFGDPWTKKTDLWGTYNLPKRKYKYWVDVPKNNNLYIRPGRGKPSIAFLHKSAMQYIYWMKEYTANTDADFRAITPRGFAQAFYEANK